MRWPWPWHRRARPNGGAAAHAQREATAKLARVGEHQHETTRAVNAFAAAVEAAIARGRHT